jgi:hypothetical protein
LCSHWWPACSSSAAACGKTPRAWSDASRGYYRHPLPPRRTAGTARNDTD